VYFYLNLKNNTVRTIINRFSFSWKKCFFDIKVFLYPVFGFLISPGIESFEWIIAGMSSNDAVSSIKSRRKAIRSIEDFKDRLLLASRSSKLIVIDAEDILRYILISQFISDITGDVDELKFKVDTLVKNFIEKSIFDQKEIEQDINLFYSNRHKLVKNR